MTKGDNRTRSSLLRTDGIRRGDLKLVVRGTMPIESLAASKIIENGAVHHGVIVSQSDRLEKRRGPGHYI
jgi:hypothetical protein